MREHLQKSKSAIINLGSGSLHQGFPQVTVQLWTLDIPRPEQFMGELPPAPTLIELHRNWQLVYRGLCDRLSYRAPHSNVQKQLQASVPLPSGLTASPTAQIAFPSFTDRASKTSALEISETGITHVSQVDFNELCQQLKKGLARQSCFRLNINCDRVLTLLILYGSSSRLKILG